MGAEWGFSLPVAGRVVQTHGAAAVEGEVKMRPARSRSGRATGTYTPGTLWLMGQHVPGWRGGRGVIAALLPLLVASRVHAATYYVATTGDDASDGTSPDTAWRTVTYAATVAAAGDTVYIKAGLYTGEVVSVSNAGTEALPREREHVPQLDRPQQHR